MTALYRLCPNCSSRRPLSEAYCETVRPEGLCQWDLLSVDISEEIPREPEIAPIPSPVAQPLCANGHVLGEGDIICLECGSSPTEVVTQSPKIQRDPPVIIIQGWRLEYQRNKQQPKATYEEYVAVNSGAQNAIVRLYDINHSPDPNVMTALKRLPSEIVPYPIYFGDHEGRAVEIIENTTEQTLASERDKFYDTPNLLRPLIEQISHALAAFTELGLRHRDLNPSNVIFKAREPLNLLITGFSAARLSDFDLETLEPMKLTRYMAPETIVGAVSSASDWWSLGMIILEFATAGAFFKDIDDQVFQLHVVTRGVSLPTTLDPDIRHLLRGLLARDPSLRWSAPEVRLWLAGTPRDLPSELPPLVEETGPSLSIGDRKFWRPESFALAAAEAANWDTGRELVLNGTLQNWLEERQFDATTVAGVRRIASNENLTEDFRYALALMLMNKDLPFTIRGEIVTPAWLLSHLEQANDLIHSEVTTHLARMEREQWIVRLKKRADSVYERAKFLEIELDEARTRTLLLSTSIFALETERNAQRKIYPDTDHLGLASLVERARLSEEDLIIVLGAAPHQFIPLQSLLDSAKELAEKNGYSFDSEAASTLLVRSRREIFGLLDERLTNFARCGETRLDEWADAFRIERRLPLERAAILLALPKERWNEPPKQQYVAALLSHFEKRVAGSISRGPLVRFSIGKTTPRIDFTEIGTNLKPAEAILNHILSRSDVPIQIDPSGYQADENCETRFRRFISYANSFRRDSGIDGRTLGFPFLLVGDGRQGKIDGVKSSVRFAPILLWPVAVELSAGAGGIPSLAFDREREEIRINPALEGILGTTVFQKWLQARDELLSKSAIRVGDVMAVFGALAEPKSRSLSALPPKGLKVPAKAFDLWCSAALFNAEFTGQSVAEDLRQMARVPQSNTGLDTALRLRPDNSETQAVPKSRKADQYMVVPNDPSQEEAIERSRLSPGLLIEGPPGTGKSQTIVNVITAAVGHGETVLVVCQKQAALKIVEKRLNAEGLGNRLFMVVDVNKDRESIIKSLREQLDSLRNTPPEQFGPARRQREELAARIEAVSASIDSHHKAMYSIDEILGISYRNILSQLIEIEAVGPWVEVPDFRVVFEQSDRARLSVTEETCVPLARLWLDSDYEINSLSVLKLFPVDSSVETRLRNGLLDLVRCEKIRADVLRDTGSVFAGTDPALCSDWLAGPFKLLNQLSISQRERLAGSLDAFKPNSGRRITGEQLVSLLSAQQEEAQLLRWDWHDSVMFEKFSKISDLSLKNALRDANWLSSSQSVIRYCDPRRWGARRRLRKFLSSLNLTSNDEGIVAVRNCLDLEHQMRPLRSNSAAIRAQLMLSKHLEARTLDEIRRDIFEHLTIANLFLSCGEAIVSCPRAKEAEAAARTGSIVDYKALEKNLSDVVRRAAVQSDSLSALNTLSSWFTEGWIDNVSTRIQGGISASQMIETVISSLSTLEPFQRFRARVPTLQPEVIAIFKALRGVAGILRAAPKHELEELVRRSIKREALLAWKTSREAKEPDLFFEREEIERKIELLGTLNQELRISNIELIRNDIQRDRVGSASAWEDITRLRGPRARRLRELIDQGEDLGLMRLRPIWLMNPDVASRILPRKAGMFDLVIYDEASQMPVEFALPTLFRSRRIIISGDEKQMPPSNFFSGKIDDADDEDDLNLGEFEAGATEAEQNAREENWNRRELKDCPDLLQLARGVLPTSMLKIHYRSQYRELINFSNAAFYRGTLSVPAQHPEKEIRRVTPIEVIRVDGIYESQSNASEASTIIEWLADFWAKNETPPSVGIVTFNRKQADLVEEHLHKRTKSDPDFLRTYNRERDRVQNGEDMGFFVKNVENVQGDERDVIVFSTTFGRDKGGNFRRNFGVLGQVGGERRLNVAVTRARTKVILVTSMPLAHVSDWISGARPPNKPRDYLQAYLHYAERLSSGDLETAKRSADRLGPQAQVSRYGGNADVSDGLLNSVRSFIRELGYEPVASSGNDAFSLDIAIEDSRTGLFGIGIECDAPQNLLLADASAREIWRPSVIKRAIPHVHRVSAQAWYHRGSEEQERLKAALTLALT